MTTDNKVDFYFMLFSLFWSMDSLAHFMLNATNYIVYHCNEGRINSSE